MNTHFERFKQYLGVDEQTSATMRKLRPVIEAGLEEIVDGFYSHMRKHPDAMAKFPGGETQLARQEQALRRWLVDLIEDDALASSTDVQMQIGAVHMAASVNEELIVASMNWLRDGIANVIRKADPLPESCTVAEGIDAINKSLDYNLGLILSSYWRLIHDRAMRADRLIQIGQYTASINHELRNPLGVIGTSAYLLRTSLGDSPDPKTKNHLDKIDRNVERANAIIAGLLRLLRVEQPQRQRVSIGDFIAKQLDNITIPKGFMVETINPSGSEAMGSFDPTQVSQVLENLIQNAIDANGTAGHIQIEYDVNPDGIVIHIRDDGPGIDASVT